MAQPPPTAGSGTEGEGRGGRGGGGGFLPINPVSEGGDDDDDDGGHAPRGSSEEARSAAAVILGGLPAGSLGQTMALPAPRIVHDFRLSAALERKVALGRSCWGERNWIGICGGQWSATWGRGKIVVWFSSLFFVLFSSEPLVSDSPTFSLKR